jgi:hypothetical protein
MAARQGAAPRKKADHVQISTPLTCLLTVWTPYSIAFSRTTSQNRVSRAISMFGDLLAASQESSSVEKDGTVNDGEQS